MSQINEQIAALDTEIKHRRIVLDVTPHEVAGYPAARLSAHPVLKIKADADAVLVRPAIPTAWSAAPTIVDASQSWTLALLRDLGGQTYVDEFCHTRADLPALQGLYQGINIDRTRQVARPRRLPVPHIQRDWA